MNIFFLVSFSVPLVAGQDSGSGGPRHRIGQIAHSVVLGTLNVGEPGEAVAPDLSRVCWAATLDLLRSFDDECINTSISQSN